MRETRKAEQIPLPIDHDIPFIVAFVVPYIFWYVFIFGYLVYFCFKDTDVYVRTLITIVIGELICFIIYFFFQTTVPRPTVEGSGAFVMLVKYINAHDRPVNCFPSIHVLTTYAIVLTSFHIKKMHKLNKLLHPHYGEPYYSFHDIHQTACYARHGCIHVSCGFYLQYSICYCKDALCRKRKYQCILVKKKTYI